LGYKEPFKPIIDNVKDNKLLKFTLKNLDNFYNNVPNVLWEHLNNFEMNIMSMNFKK
jgi:hypothetical protein